MDGGAVCATWAKRRSRWAQAALVVLLGACLRAPEAFAQPASAAQASASPRTMTWEELVPEDWDPMSRFRGEDLSLVREGSVRERQLMNLLRDEWDKAPTRSALDGSRVRLPGYVVPLERAKAGAVKEFLLVPYFGACVHAPPPPANQIVLVTLGKPAKLATMDAVWVSGTLSTRRQDSPMGVSGYRMTGEQVEPY